MGISEEDNLQVLFALSQALESHASWGHLTFRAYLAIMLDAVFLSSSASICSERQRVVHQMLFPVMREAAFQFRDFVQANNSDSFLDVVCEEWELHKAPHIDVKQFCGDPRRLLRGETLRSQP